jgi:hypothetical protein
MDVSLERQSDDYEYIRERRAMNQFAPVLLAVCVSLCANALCQKTNTGANSGVSSGSHSLTPANDPDAIALMQRVLNTMGGADAWRSVGAATATVTWTMPGGTEKQIHWADDWSGPSTLSRREAVGAPSGSSKVITSGHFQSHIKANGTQKQYPSDPDLVILAVGYPGAAIHRSLQRPNCTFATQNKPLGRWPRPPLTGNQDETIVYEQCIEPFFPDGRCDIAWIVSADAAQLLGAWLPVRGMLDNTITYELVRYDRFQAVGRLSAPSNITITRPTGRVDRLTVDSHAFSSQLPTSVFDSTK